MARLDPIKIILGASLCAFTNCVINTFYFCNLLSNVKILRLLRIYYRFTLTV